jgi:protein TonB
MRRTALSWLGSSGLHLAVFAWLSTAATMQVQFSFQRGKTSIELQASVAAAPPEELEPKVTTEADRPKPKTEPQPPEPLPTDDPLARRPPQLPDATRPTTEPPPDVVAVVEPPPPERAEPKEEIVEVEVEPPPKKTADAKPRVIESPVESVASVAAQAQAGVEYDELPHPHPQNRQPPYPREAYLQRLQGTVVLHLQVLADGTIGDVRVIHSSGVQSLDDAAVRAARQWRYTPARRAGTSVAIVFETRVNFTIRS